MKPDRWQQIDRLLDPALELDAEERAAFLDEACAGDAELRAEVESLLAAHEQAGSFIEAPAMDAAARLSIADNETLAAGQTIGHYEIRAYIGAGGMGEVYLAQDIRLKRSVALKLLPAAFAAEQNRLRRFEHEARAASALNHPNILTVYEIGHAGETHFIATEYIDGETLRQRIARGSMKTLEILEIATQVAAALAAAHQAGIVHRDIKPENVMRRADGYVKVLDFGIAKLIEQSAGKEFIDSEAPTRRMFNTEAGMVLGTIAYMSPEHVRGQAVDARTDIWSLGCLIYEMAAGGRVPFEGRTSNHVAVSILDQEPAPLALYDSESSGMLQWIISKALRKDRDERYQTAKELLADLRSLQRKMEFESELERSVPPHSSGTREERLLQSLDGKTPRSIEIAATSRSTSSAEYLIGEIGRRKKSVALALLIFIAVVSFIGFGFYGLLYHRQQPVRSFNSMKVTRLATDGEVRLAVISPDGKYVAHVLEESGRQSLWIRQAAAAGNPQVVAPASEVRFIGATFSHDGNYLYYVTKQRNNSIGVLYQVPALGGASVKLLTDVDSPVALSPDNTQIVFARASSSGESSLIVANADGTGERKLAMRSGDDFYSIAGAAWSPDGQKIACGAGSRKGVPHMSVFEVALKDGAEKAIASQVWASVGQIVWLKDNSGLVLTAIDQPGSTAGQLWYLAYTNGAEAEARRITNDLSNYNGVSLANDSDTLLSLQGEIVSNIWSAPTADASESRAKQLTSSKYDGLNGLFWMPDNKRLVYTSSASGKESLWTVNADGTGEKQLSNRGSSYAHPSVSPDGRYAYFISDLAGGRNIWRLEIDDGGLKQLSTGGAERYARISPDGQWIFYSFTSAGKTSLWRMNADGSLPVQLTDKSAVLPVISPDGKLIACYYREETKSPWKIAILSSEDGTLVKTFDIPSTVILLTRLSWTPDGRAIAYIDDRNGVSNLWCQPMDGGTPKQLTDFKTQRIFAFNWSRDGSLLACARGNVTSDVVALSDFR